MYQTYYGSAIPPQQAYQRRRSCFCCLLSTFIKAFIVFCVVLGIAVLVLWLIFRPTKMKVTVEDASLTNFTLTTNPSTVLSYNLTTDISLRNPNKHIGIYYDWLEADAYFKEQRFSWTGLQTFYQGHKNTTMLYPSFSGTSAISLGNSDVQDYKRMNSTGYFDVDVWLYGRVRYKFGSTITRRYTMRVKCELLIPMVTNGKSNAGFTTTDCDVVDF